MAKNLIKQFFILPIKLYRLFASPYFGHQCRFTPTCSEYAEMCIRQHGVVKGLYLTVRRLLKCHPWHESGLDLVPDTIPTASGFSTRRRGASRRSVCRIHEDGERRRQQSRKFNREGYNYSHQTKP